ncbi:13565_t:CDS:2 [Cetraspora pellucida]|uniref:13565_t:CDS:1 n=1 Tax=Cetraspora pellucida TaxID=1433469 RepID=A0A9N9BE43_9GLOM|nr:13565_t:CDS:2 [Cetraspora pellucida]
MSFFKKLTKKFNKKQNKENEDISWRNIGDSTPFENFDENYYNNWGEEEDNNWNNEEWNNEENDQSTWSTNNEETPQDEDLSATVIVEQENRAENISDTLVLKNEKYQLEYLLIILNLLFILISTPVAFGFGLLLLFRFKFLLEKARLADGDYYTFLNPFDIKFSQANISNVFSYSGKTLEETIEQLLEEDVECIKNIQAIEVCIINDTYYSSDNRRLYCFREAIKRGLEIKKIPVLVRRFTDTNMKWKLEGSYKIIQNKNFNNINISDKAANGRVIDEDGDTKTIMSTVETI